MVVGFEAKKETDVKRRNQILKFFSYGLEREAQIYLGQFTVTSSDPTNVAKNQERSAPCWSNWTTCSSIKN